MTRADLVAMAQRTLAHARAGTAPLAESVVEVPTRTYVDPNQWALEMDRIWRRVPLVLAPSVALPEAGSYVALDVAEVPVLLSRGADGEVRAFVNSCAHRGAIVMEEGHGIARRFTCPYHGWSYDQDGALGGILDREAFGEIEVDCHGLTALPCEERAGFVWGSLDPQAELDLDAWLLGYDDVLDHLGLAGCHLVGRQEVAGPNWKVAYDGYLDFYHLPILHKDSFGPDYSNKACYDAWGPHQRLLQPDDRVIAALDTMPEDDWTDEKLTGGVWTVFPGISVASFDVGGRMFMVSVLSPGSAVGSSRTVQYFLAPFVPDEEQQRAIDKRIEFLLGVVRDEDYATGLRIQRALATGAKDHVLFGRNEAGGQRFHEWVEALVGADDAAALASVVATADVVHQP
ncbi:MAG: aromatic ring-hydroxylating dioxygenase subunit alpha [Acidimicrobiales bacterium]|nr:aromatic ring-hydroxylating dioxygenase subunit alpha [Acidimicrobiales bacterium]